jgi:hypothetical protein
MHAIVRNPSKLTPQLIPILRNMGLENMMAAAASPDRAKSLAAKREAAYCG